MNERLEEFEYLIDKYKKIKKNNSKREIYQELTELIKGKEDISYQIKVSALLEELLNNLGLKEDDVDSTITIVSPTIVRGTYNNLYEYLESFEKEYGENVLNNMCLNLNIYEKNNKNPFKERMSISWKTDIFSLDTSLLKELIISNYTNYNYEEYTVLLFNGDINKLVIDCNLNNLLFECMLLHSNKKEIVQESLFNTIRNSLLEEKSKVLTR